MKIFYNRCIKQLIALFKKILMRWQKCGRSCQGHGLQIFDGNVTHLDIDRFSRNLGKLSFSYMSTTTENVSSIGKKKWGEDTP